MKVGSVFGKVAGKEGTVLHGRKVPRCVDLCADRGVYFDLAKSVYEW